MQDRFLVGIITGTHGIGGEVKVYPTTDDIKRFKKLKSVIMDNGKRQSEMAVAGARFSGDMVILKFKGYDDINQVEAFKGNELYVTRENAVKPGKDEYFIADLIGLKVISTDGEELGVIKDVIETGANDVYEIKTSDGGELLIPAIGECIREVDVAGGVVTVYLMPGLR
ncbi:MAG: ribosome maturation factor RimM [Clostridiales bacterium]|nr:ribosome maturation factor RimM [Clostridiales bacterium]